MLKLVRFGQKNERGLIRMMDMKPLQVGVVIDGSYEGAVVMRTASMNKPEVMNLSDPSVGRCWTTGQVTMTVRLLPPGEKVVVELFNE